MSSARNQRSSVGLLYGLSAYGIWGFLPLYFKTVGRVKPLELVAHRIVWSVLVLAVLVTAARRGRDWVSSFRRPSLLATLAVSATLIAANWLIYIYGVLTNRVLQASLGYFINPLLNVLLGLVFLREHLRRLEWIALSLAVAGVGYLVVSLGEVPWLALLLASTFALYGLVRKVTPVDGLIGVSVETVILLPLAIALLWNEVRNGTAAFVGDWALTARLTLSGVLTAVPLLCFGQAARRLPLSVLGFLQYLTPTVQFVLALWVYREPMSRGHWIGFPCIWLGLFVFAIDGALRRTSELRRASSDNGGPRN